MLDKDFLASYYRAGDTFPNLLARSTYLSKYKRDSDACWTDTVLRVVLGNVKADPTVSQAEAEKLFDAIWRCYALPPGRGLWTGGVDGIPVGARNNCAYLTIKSIEDWCWVANQLMLGVGVGCGLLRIGDLPSVSVGSPRLNVLCSRSHPNRAEVLPDDPAIVENVYVVDDTRQGWVEALRQTLQCAFDGRALTLNVSSIRPRGARIRTFGGVACGPGPLATLVRNVWAIVRGAQGRKLRSAECLDVTNHIGLCIKSGNVRRSALIVLGDATDTEFRNAKKDFNAVLSHRSTSNNSIVFDREEQFDTFDWRALVEDNSVMGEPGILNLWKIRQTDPGAMGINPCFRADTRIHTRTGHYEIKELVGHEVEVWDGNNWRHVSTFRKTSENEPMLKFTLQDGSSFAVTKYHIVVTESGERIEAKDVKVGTKLRISNAPLAHGRISEPGAYAKGFCVGDGTRDAEGQKPILWVYPPKKDCLERLIRSFSEIEPDNRRMRTDCVREVGSRAMSRGFEVTGLRSRADSLLPWCTEHKKRLPKHAFQWDHSSKCEFVAGVMDADGTAQDGANGYRYQVFSIEKEFLLDFQELLKTMGVRSKLGLMKKSGIVDMNDGYGEYPTKDCWRLTISQSASISLASQVTFSRLRSLADKRLAYELSPRFNTVVSIEDDGVDADVYCLVTDDPDQIACSNGLMIGRCGEQPLHDKEVCNLSEVYPARYPADRSDEILKLITRYTIRQRLAPMEDAEADEVRTRNMRVGIGLGGVCDFDATCELMESMYKTVRTCADDYCRDLGVNRCIAVTTVKPSGTISLLCGSSPGIHAPFAPFYIRRTRISKQEPMAGALMEAGVPHEPCVYDKTNNTLVFSFPMSATNASEWVVTESVDSQIARQMSVQKSWADNAVSTTISFRECEKERLAELLAVSAKEMKSISCLPKSHGYEQPPYSECSRDEYERMITSIDNEHPLIAGGDIEIDECQGGACPIR